MANTSISNLSAGAAVSATDLFPDVQTVGVGPVKVTAAQLKTFMSASPTLVTPTLGVATGTSLALGGATIGAAAVAATVTQAANTSADGFVLIDSTAATSGNQQYSPRLRLTGQGWKTTAAAASQTVDWIAELQPVQGTTAPTANLVFSSQVNGGGYLPGFSISSNVSATNNPLLLSWDPSAIDPFLGKTAITGVRYTNVGIQIYRNSGIVATFDGSAAAALNLMNGNLLGFAAGTGAADLLVSRAAAATLQLGAADASSAVAQTLRVQSVVAGTTNAAGADFSIYGSKGTGTGAGGSIKFYTSPAGSTGSTQNAGVLALTIDSTKLATFAGGLQAATLALGGATIGSNALAVTGTTNFGGSINFAAANTYDIGASTPPRYIFVGNTLQIDSDTGQLVVGHTRFAIMTSPAAATFQLGAADASSAAAQTLQVQSVVAGTTNAAGADLSIYGSKSTGTGAGGSIKFYTSPAGSTGSTQNAGTLGLTITSAKSVVLNNAAIATNATDGFLYIASGAGTPTGVPTANTGRVALYYDTTNHQFWIYDGAWLQPKTPAGAATVTWQ